jgi:hypothetical protein
MKEKKVGRREGVRERRREKEGIWISDKKMLRKSWVWWCIPVISALGRLRQEDFKFNGSLFYVAKP